MSNAESFGPLSEAVRELQRTLSTAVWERRAAEAQRCVQVIEAVEEMREQTGLSVRKCLDSIASEVSSPRYYSLLKRSRKGSGQKWERLVDRRTPPGREAIRDDVRSATAMLRRTDPEMDCDTARMHLKAQFGNRGAISNTSIRRIWSATGLTSPGGRGPREKVEAYHGGGGLALVGTAALETEAALTLAKAALEAGREAASQDDGNEEVSVDPEGRDAWGRLTADYNRSVRSDMREPGQQDPRLASDATKRAERDLATLSILQQKPSTVASKLLCTGVIPLLTERRGFDGLSGPQGEWLGLLGGPAYMPATLDKCLAQMAFLNVGAALWGAHGQQWSHFAQCWSEGGPAWLRLLFYVDSTQEPYWTRRYAASGKVSRTGRVMPCLSRIAVMAGPGIPLLVTTVAGAVSLKEELMPTLAGLEDVVGEGEIGRIVIVDAEISTSVKVLTALESLGSRRFITVLKGPLLKSKQVEDGSVEEWGNYRERDRIREFGRVILNGEGAPEGGLKLRAVEMRREGRRSKSTIFLTNAPVEELSTQDIPTAYLTRWPHQEQCFRNGRNGGGLNRTHGYGGDYVTNVALQTALEKAEGKVKRAEARLETAQIRLADANSLERSVEEDRGTRIKAARQAARLAKKESLAVEEDLQRTRKELDRISAQDEPDHSPRQALEQRAAELKARAQRASAELTTATSSKEAEEKPLEAARHAVSLANKERNAAQRTVKTTRAELDKKRTTPREIYRRDPTRENIANALTTMALMLIEFVLREYFGGVRMEWRTFVELFVGLPVTVRTSRHRILYEIGGNPRDPRRTEQLRQACAEVSRRKLRQDGKLIEYRVIDAG